MMFAGCFLLASYGYSDTFKTNTASAQPIGNRPALDKLISTATATSGLTLGVDILDYGIGTNTTELPIGLIFKAPANTQSAFYLPQEEYLARLELYDSNNHAVTKTKLGAQYGQLFDELYWDIGKFATPHNGGHPKMITVRDEWDSRSWGCNLQKVSDLFTITEPGQYRLKVEVQIMLLYLNTKEKQVRQISRFPPIEIMVTCPKATKIKK